MTSPEALLARARRDLEAARHLAEGKFAPAAISRSYYAAFHAAEAALLALGETRSKHSGVIAAFETLVVREGGIEAAHGATLRSLFRQRNEADYGPAEFRADEATAVLADAERFIDAVGDWLAHRPPPASIT
jgi:hypothetical protein